MFLSVYNGQCFSYSYETETGDFFLHSNDYKIHKFLKGDAARLFELKLDYLDCLPPPISNSGIETEKLIKLFL